MWRPKPGPTPSAASPTLNLIWAFEAPRPGYVIASPLVTQRTIYLAVGHAQGFSTRGAVYAIDASTGKTRWVFDGEGTMLPTASSPLLLGQKLYFGEGMHANFACKLYCLDSETGKPDWSREVGDHIEGGPTADGDLVLFPAGNDGVYAVAAADGSPRWNFRADLHVDSTTVVQDGRAYLGSGPSRKFKDSRVICLQAKTGKPLWRVPIALPAWVEPVVSEGRVFVGLGNGRLTEGAKSPEIPAGALACFDAATGTHLWSFPVADAVFGRPVVVNGRVIFGSRDGNLYGLSLDGREQFRVALGGPVIASPTLERGLVYAASVPGRLICLDPSDGQEIWRHELAHPGAVPQVYASLRIADQRIYSAAEMQTSNSSVGIISLNCFALPNGGKR